MSRPFVPDLVPHPSRPTDTQVDRRRIRYRLRWNVSAKLVLRIAESLGLVRRNSPREVVGPWLLRHCLLLPIGDITRLWALLDSCGDADECGVCLYWCPCMRASRHSESQSEFSVLSKQGVLRRGRLMVKRTYPLPGFELDDSSGLSPLGLGVGLVRELAGSRRHCWKFCRIFRSSNSCYCGGAHSSGNPPSVVF